MGKKCFVLNCTNTYKNTRNVCVIDEKTFSLTTITYHSFPKDPFVKEKWAKATGRKNWTPVNGNSFICSEHFKESDFYMERNGIKGKDISQQPKVRLRVLKRNAIPTVNLSNADDVGESETCSQETEYSIPPSVPAATNFFHSSTFSTVEDINNIEKENLINQTNKVVNDQVLLDSVKIEPEFESINHQPISLTSTLTIKEENDSCDKYNGIFEPEISLQESSSPMFNNVATPNSDEVSEPEWKRTKVDNDNNLIHPDDIKVEKSETPLNNFDPSLEHKYEKLLDQYLLLKKDYDIIKTKYERQKEALSECEKILRTCR